MAFALLFITYPACSKIVFSYFICETWDGEGEDKRRFLRADRSLIGKRNIAAGQVNAVQDFAATTRCQVSAQPRAAALASDLGMPADVLSADGPFAYGLVARGEAMTYFDLPETAADFDASISAHAAGTLLVAESGGMVTDTAGNALDLIVAQQARALEAALPVAQAVRLTPTETALMPH